MTGTRPSLRRVLPGFGHINRYWDQTRLSMAAKVLPGEFYVSCQDEFMLTTLGSCVSACVWDPVAGVGGLNHFMLPEPGRGFECDLKSPNDATRYGLFAMEFLINGILQHGGKRARLLAKIAGGGRVLRQATDIGLRNIAFVRQYLLLESLQVVGEHLGGDLPRKLCFHPLTGRAQIKLLDNMTNSTIADRERQYSADLARRSQQGLVEIFDRDSP